MIEVPNAFPLRPIDVPASVSRTEGCNCGGGLDWHKPNCSIFDLPYEDRRAAADAAYARVREFDAGLNAQLRAAGL